MKKKFRAWDEFDKKMSFWTMNDLCNYCPDRDKPSCLDEWMQYIGLSDKNGKEICESDILKLIRKGKTYIGVVKYFEDFCSFLLEGKGFRVDIFSGDEIIGNVHENPKLI